MMNSFLKKPWFGLVAFALIWCALRVLWIDGDAGIPSVWEYGYNVTDEGYYMGAAKDKLLRGCFNDLDCNECFTYGYSAGTHWLSYLGCLAFGLNSWGFRVPFLLLYLLGWCAVFHFIAKRRGGLAAFIWCTAFACMPVVVAYERTAGNDLTIAALTALAFCVASGKGVWRIPVSALLTGAVILIKPSVWALLPIVLSAVLSERKTRRAWVDALLYVILAVASVWLCKQLAVLSVRTEAAQAGISAVDLIRRTTTHNALPKLSDYMTFLRGFSSFPRDPTMALVSVATIFMSVVPLAMALRDIVRRKWLWRILFNLSIPAYVAGISSLNTIYTHYFHPVLMLMPVVWFVAETSLKEDDEPEQEHVPFVRLALPYAFGAVALALLALYACDMAFRPQLLQEYYSKVYNLPAKVVWGLNGGLIALFAAGLAVLVFAFRGFHAARRSGWQWFLVAAVGGSVAFAGLPAVHFAHWLHKAQGFYLPHVLLVLFATLVFVVTAYAVPASRFRRWALFLFPALAVLCAYLFAPSWRSAAVEMLQPPTHVCRDVGREVAKLVPSDAIVIGERTRQVLMAQPHRTATTMPACDAIPIVRKLFTKDPAAKVYALLDSQNAYNLKHFQDHRGEFALQLLKTFKMPSFGDASPADVHLCRVVPVKNAKEPEK